MRASPLKKPEPFQPLVAAGFSFGLEQVQGCCQMAVLFGLGYNRSFLSEMSAEEAATLLTTIRDATLDELGRYEDGDEEYDRQFASDSYAVIAVTSSAQRAWEIALEKMGFTKQGPWNANTGSILTHWALLPDK